MSTPAQRSKSSSIAATTRTTQQLRSDIHRQKEQSKACNQHYFYDRSTLFNSYPSTEDGVPAQGNNPWHIYLSDTDLEFRNSGTSFILQMYEDEELGGDNFFIFREKHHDAADEFGQTPLHLAIENPCEDSDNASNRTLKLIRYLVSGAPAKGRRGAISPCNFNAQTLTGDTPAHLAVRSTSPRSIEILAILSAAGADFNLKNKEGYTPLTLLLREIFKKSKNLTSIDSTLDTLVSKIAWMMSLSGVSVMFEAFQNSGLEGEGRSNIAVAIESLINILKFGSSCPLSVRQEIFKNDGVFQKFEKIIAEACQQYLLTSDSKEVLSHFFHNLMICAVVAKDKHLIETLQNTGLYLETEEHTDVLSLLLSSASFIENVPTQEFVALLKLLLCRKNEEYDLVYYARLGRVFQGRGDQQATILHEMVACGERVALVGVLLDCFERVPMSVQLDLLNARDAGGKRPLALLAHNREKMPEQYSSDEWDVIEQRLQAIEAKFRLKQEPYARTKAFFSALWYGVLWLISLPLMLFSNPDNFHTQVEGKWRHYVRDRLDPPLVLPAEMPLTVSVDGHNTTVESALVDLNPAFTPQAAQSMTPTGHQSPTSSLVGGQHSAHPIPAANRI